MSAQPALTVVASNKVTYADIEAAAIQLGATLGAGKDSQIKFLMKALEGSFQGALDMDPNKHGKDIDDATKLTEAYVKAQSGATVFDAKAPNQRKAVSCTRTLVKLGQWPKGGSGEPMATVNNLMTMRQQFRKDPTKAKLLDDAANTLLRYARTQMKQDTLIDASGLTELCFRKQPDPRTAEEILESARKQLIDLVNGKAAGGTAQDATKHVKAAVQSLTDRMKEIATARGAAKGAAPAPATV